MGAVGAAIAGETVHVRLRTLVGHDRLGDEVWSHGEEPADVRVENVLVNPGTTTYDRTDEGHPEAIECGLTLHFPREFDEDLRGAIVSVRGTDYEVVGTPVRYTDENLPPGCPWNLTAKVARRDG
jgi:hypothetical protein